MTESDEKIRDLEERLKKAEAIIEGYHEKKLRSWRRKWLVGKSVAKVFVGPGLIAAVRKLIDEIFDKEKSIERSTVAEVASHALWRFTRIGIFTLLVATVPLVILLVQTIILNNQNRKIDIQNELILRQNTRLDQQTHLLEASRRSSLVFLFSNLLDRIDGELQLEGNTERELSPQLIGRAYALTNALKPYRYMRGDSLSPLPTSPERGQLLLAILESEIGEQSLHRLLGRANFTYSELQAANLENRILPGTDLRDANFTYARLSSASFDRCYLNGAEFYSSDAQNAKFTNSILSNSSFVEADLGGTDFRNAYLEKSNFNKANLIGAELFNTDGYMAQFQKARFGNAKIDFCKMIMSNFDGARLDSTSLTFSELRHLSLRNANLARTDFSFSDMQWADFRGAKIHFCIFNHTTLDNAKVSFSAWPDSLSPEVLIYLDSTYYISGPKNDSKEGPDSKYYNLIPKNM